jgi:hypothetical protein
MNKAKLIKKIRKEISCSEKEKEQLKSWINERRAEIKSYSKKLSEIIEIKERIDLCINNFNEISDLDKEHYYSKKIYWYSKNDEKILFFEGRKFTIIELNNASQFIIREISSYEYQIQHLAEILNNEIEKLFLMEKYFYLMIYAFDYLVMGEEAIVINNREGYIYSWFIEYGGSYYLHPPEIIKTDQTVKYSVEQVLYFLESLYLTDLKNNVLLLSLKESNNENNNIAKNITDIQLEGVLTGAPKIDDQMNEITESAAIDSYNNGQIVDLELDIPENALNPDKPIIYVEGKTDVVYLNKAFELLYSSTLIKRHA